MSAMCVMATGLVLTVWSAGGPDRDASVTGAEHRRGGRAHGQDQAHGRPGGTGGGSGAGAAPGPVVVNGRVQPPRVRVPRAASGRYWRVPVPAAPPPGTGMLVPYAVEVERGLPFRAGRFAAEVHRVLNDPRGWGRGGRFRFTRVARGPVRFTVALSSPALTDRMCLPARTHGWLSCHNGGRAVLNARRWGMGAAPYGADLAGYREYLINHEVGHALGHGHRTCPGPGRLAPVMVQQTMSLYGCRANPWPFPRGSKAPGPGGARARRGPG